MRKEQGKVRLFKGSNEATRKDKVIVALRRRIEEHVQDKNISDIKRMHFVGLIQNTESFAVH